MSSAGRLRLMSPLRSAVPVRQVCGGRSTTAAAPAPAAANLLENAPPTPAPAPKPFSEIPGPPSLPLLKSLLSFLPGGRYFNVPVIKQLNLFKEQYGRICRLEVPFKHPIVFLYEPGAVQTMLQADGRNPIRGEYLPYKKYRTSRGLGVGIAAAEGDQWREYREMGQRVLGGPQAALKYIQQNTEAADMLVSHLRRVRDRENTVTGFQEHAKLWSFESMNMMALGYPVGIFDDNVVAKRLFEASIDLFECFTVIEQELPLWRLWKTKTYKRMGRAVDTIWEVCLGYVARALEDPVGGSMVAQMAPEITSERKRLMVTDVFTDLLFSAIDTTSTTLTYLIHCLAMNPEKQDRAREEVLSFLPHPDSAVTPQIVNKLSYVKACLKEALRLHQVAMGVGRVLSKEVVLDGYRVPEGIRCVALTGVTCKDPEYFQDPETFLPERWVRGSPHYTKASQWTYLPFGHGTRMCIGRRFAELETWIAAAQLLRNFRISAVTPEFRQVMKLINVPDRPIDVRFTDLTS